MRQNALEVSPRLKTSVVSRHQGGGTHMMSSPEETNLLCLNWTQNPLILLTVPHIHGMSHSETSKLWTHQLKPGNCEMNQKLRDAETKERQGLREPNLSKNQ